MPQHPRLDQLIASLGYGSRREAGLWIAEGRVTLVAGGPGARRLDAGLRVDPALVRLDGGPLDHPFGLTLVLNKPAGVVCSHDPREGRSVYDLLEPRWRRRNPAVVSVGRLDKETTGLLLLTDQTGLVHRLTSPRHKVAKVYEAGLDREPPAGLAGVFASGTLLLPEETQPCAPALLEISGPRTARLPITEGRYHQVRRMFACQGLEVLTLHRSRLGSLDLEGLPPGGLREIDPAQAGLGP